VLPELAGIGATLAARASLAGVAKRCPPGDLADELGRRQRPEARLVEELRRDLGDARGDLALKLVDRNGELAQAAQLVARDPDAHRLLGAGQTSPDSCAPLLSVRTMRPRAS
jgi:hypothetical protein